jgi:lipopolysaccharide heptosyltransferase II
LGDVVLTLPILSVLRRCIPHAHIAMLLKRYTGEIVEGNPFLDEIIWYDNDDSLIPFLEMCRILRSRNFDAAVVVYPRARLAMLMACSGIPIRIGTGYRYYSFLFNRRVYEHRSQAGKHEVEYNLNLLKHLGCTGHEAPQFAIHVPAEATISVSRLLDKLCIGADERIVALHPGSGGSAREWPAANFGSLAEKLIDRSKVAVVVTGGSGEEAKVREVIRASKEKAIPVVSMPSVKELAALLARCSLVIANSTGPLHIAAALGVPVIGLYPQHTPMSAKRWGPIASRKKVFVPDRPADCKDCTSGKEQYCHCMASVTIDQVYEAARGMLQSPEPREKQRA